MDKRVAIFLATSGHSGVDRIMGNLVREFSLRAIPVDLIRIKKHGPYVKGPLPHIRIVEFPTSHVNTALPHLVRYLKQIRPKALLTDKDRVNRLAIIARKLSGLRIRLVIRVGTTVSVNLARRGLVHRKMQLASIKHLYPKADAVVVPSKGAAQDLISISPPLLKTVKILPSPVVDEEIKQKAEAPIPQPWFSGGRVPVILGVGELCARKDFETLVRAFVMVRAQRPSRLVILGEGNKRRELETLVKELGVEEWVHMPGFVDNPFPYIKKASVLALSSRCEGLPVVLVEALALGTPVVSTDCPSGPREILQGGRIGHLVPIADPKAMARALLASLDNPPDPKLLISGAAPYSVASSTEAYLQTLGFRS